MVKKMPAKKDTNLHEAYKPNRGPKAILDYFYNKVNIVESIMIVVIAFILNALIYWLMKGQNLADYSVMQIYSTILINWFVLGVMVFLMMYFIRGQKNLPKRPFEKVLSSLAAFRATTIIYSVLCAIIIVILFPNLISIIQTVSVNPATIDSSTLIPVLSVANIIGVVLFFLLTIFMIIYWIIMLYEFTEIIFDVKEVFPKIALMIILFLVLVLINLL